MELFKYVDLNITSTQSRTPRSGCKEWNDVNEIIANIGIIDNNSNINNFNIFRIVRYHFESRDIKICELKNMI